MRFVQFVVRASMNGHGSLALRRFGGVHLACSFKCARDPDPEVTQDRRSRPCRVVVEKNVVATTPQAGLAADESPDLVKGRPPRRANRTGHALTPHRSQIAWMNGL